jgi:hypothetical protein
MGINQKGYVAPMVMVISFIIGILLMDLVRVAYFDRRIERNVLEIMQAQQAADGGVAWASEKIYQTLLASAAQEILPPSPLMPGLAPVKIGKDEYGISFVIRDGAVLQDSGSDYCTYEFRCRGSCINTQKTVRVRLRFKYHNRYQVDGSGNKIFVSRDFLDRGKIVLYKNDDV